MHAANVIGAHLLPLLDGFQQVPWAHKKVIIDFDGVVVLPKLEDGRKIDQRLLGQIVVAVAHGQEHKVPMLASFFAQERVGCFVVKLTDDETKRDPVLLGAREVLCRPGKPRRTQ